MMKMNSKVFQNNSLLEGVCESKRICKTKTHLSDQDQLLWLSPHDKITSKRDVDFNVEYVTTRQRTMAQALLSFVDLTCKVVVV